MPILILGGFYILQSFIKALVWLGLGYLNGKIISQREGDTLSEPTRSRL